MTVFSILVLAALGCGEGSDSGDPGGGGDGGSADGGSDAGDGGADGGSGDGGDGALSFATDIYPLFQRSCDDCHDYWGQSAEGVLNLLTSDVYDPPLVVPFDAAGSAFYTRTTPDGGGKSRMPLQPEPLSSSQIDTLRDWIEGGAVEGQFFAAFDQVYRAQEHRCQICHKDWEQGQSVYDYLVATELGGWAMIAPGQPDDSLLYVKVAGGDIPFGAAMPLQPPMFSEEEQARVAQWIDEGAAP